MDTVQEKRKPEARKLLEISIESPASGRLPRPTKWGLGIRREASPKVIMMGSEYYFIKSIIIPGSMPTIIGSITDEKNLIKLAELKGQMGKRVASA